MNEVEWYRWGAALWELTGSCINKWTAIILYSGMASNSREDKKGRQRSRNAVKSTADSAWERRGRRGGRFEDVQSCKKNRMRQRRYESKRAQVVSACRSNWSNRQVTKEEGQKDHFKPRNQPVYTPDHPSCVSQWNRHSSKKLQTGCKQRSFSNFPIWMTFLHHGTQCLRHFPFIILSFHRLQSTKVEWGKRGSETEAAIESKERGKVSRAFLPFKS